MANSEEGTETTESDQSNYLFAFLGAISAIVVGLHFFDDRKIQTIREPASAISSLAANAESSDFVPESYLFYIY